MYFLKSNQIFFLSLCFFAFADSPFCQAQQEIFLPSLIHESTASSEADTQGASVRLKLKKLSEKESSSIQSQIQSQFALSTSDMGQRGTFSQVRGHGLSADDVDIEMFGISLNPPQGGGLNLSSFPRFLWSDLSYQLGPSANGLNPSSTSGVLSMTPWSAAALSDQKNQMGFSQHYSGLGVNQLSASFQNKDLALVFGMSALNSVGPSGGLSFKWKESRLWSGKFHFLGSDLDSLSAGSVEYLSPRARIRAKRWIPLIENTWIFEGVGQLRSVVFYDFSRLNYSDPDQSFDSDDFTSQWGMDHSLKMKSWTLGYSYRQIDYSGKGFQAPLQNQSQVRVSRQVPLGMWVLEPSIQVFYVNEFGLLPQGGVGLKKEVAAGRGQVFGRLNVSHKLPTLLDRYYAMPNFVGNPDLRSETHGTGMIGGSYSDSNWEGSLQVFGQYRKNVRLFMGNTVNHQGDGGVISVLSRVQYRMFNQNYLFHTASLSHSKLELTQGAFPYLPFYLGTLGFRSEWGSNQRKNGLYVNLRASSDRVSRVDREQRLSSYAVLDCGVQLSVSPHLSFGVQIENLAGNPVELMAGFPLGRVVSFQLTGQI